MKAPRFLKKIMSIISKAKSIADLKNRMRNLKTRFMIYSLLSTDKKVLFGSISSKLQDLVLTHYESSHHQLVNETQVVELEEKAADGEETRTNLVDLQHIAPILYNNMNATMYPLTITNVNNYQNEEEEVMVADTCVQEEEEEEAKRHQNTEEEITNFAISDHERDETEREDYDNNHQTKDIYPDLRHSMFEDEDEYEMGRPGSVIELVKKSKEAEDGEEFKLEDQIDEVADLFIQRFHQHMWIQKQNSFKRRSNTSSTN